MGCRQGVDTGNSLFCAQDPAQEILVVPRFLPKKFPQLFVVVQNRSFCTKNPAFLYEKTRFVGKLSKNGFQSILLPKIIILRLSASEVRFLKKSSFPTHFNAGIFEKKLCPGSCPSEYGRAQVPAQEILVVPRIVPVSRVYPLLKAQIF